MQHESAYSLIRHVEVLVSGTVSHIDIHDVPAAEQKTVTRLRQQLADARLDIRDYEVSDTRAEQLQHARHAASRLEHIRTGILKCSEFGIFGAADVAQLTAQIDHVSQLLE